MPEEAIMTSDNDSSWARDDVPWIKIWVGDFMRDTAYLTPAQRGALIMLMMVVWMHGELPPNDRIAFVVGMTAEEWSAAEPVVLPCFESMRRGLRNDWTKARDARRSITRRNKGAAKARWSQGA
jgi:uncharacterized protein YdaU (DUF1376 family)